MEMLDTVQVMLLSLTRTHHPWPLGSPHCYTSETSFQAGPSLQSWPHRCQKLLVSNKSLEARSRPKNSEFLLTFHKVTLNSLGANVWKSQSHLNRTAERGGQSTQKGKHVCGSSSIRTILWTTHVLWSIRVRTLPKNRVWAWLEEKPPDSCLNGLLLIIHEGVDQEWPLRSTSL